MTKKCPKCEQTKDREIEFGKDKNRPGGTSSWCLECKRIYLRERYKANPEKAKANCKQWRQENPDQVKTIRLRQYGITLEEYRDLEQEQNFSCAICEKLSSECNKGLHVDHCHSTGKIRGLLCSKCNTAIGLLDDKPDRVHKVMNYLQR